MFPIFIMLLLGIIEFAFMFNAVLSANYATRDASLIAAEAGSNPGADCVIIAKVLADMQAPVDNTSVSQVIIYRAKPSGDPWNGSYTGSGNVWDRTGTIANPSGTTDCSAYGGLAALPFAMTSSNYPEGLPNLNNGTGGRCTYLNGCPDNTLRTRDAIGVQLTYNYTWHTPLRQLRAPAAATASRSSGPTRCGWSRSCEPPASVEPARHRRRGGTASAARDWSSSRSWSRCS